MAPRWLYCPRFSARYVKIRICREAMILSFVACLSRAVTAGDRFSSYSGFRIRCIQPTTYGFSKTCRKFATSSLISACGFCWSFCVCVCVCFVCLFCFVFWQYKLALVSIDVNTGGRLYRDRLSRISLQDGIVFKYPLTLNDHWPLSLTITSTPKCVIRYLSIPKL